MTSPLPSSQSSQEEREIQVKLLTGKTEEQEERKNESSSCLLSKKQLKRQQKRQLVLDERPAKRAAERARKKAKKQNNQAHSQQANSQSNNLPPKKTVSIFPAIVAFDCRFDDKMSDKEIVSLDRQIAHSYSINRKASVQFTRLVCASFNGRLRKRFQDNGNQYLRWKGVKFTEESIERIASKDNQHPTDPESTEGGGCQSSLTQNEPPQPVGTAGSEDAGPTGVSGSDPARSQEQKPLPCLTPADQPEKEKDRSDPKKAECQLQPDQKLIPAEMLGPENVVYLSADSTNVLTEIEPNKVYVIGSIVDHNRHKNLCLDLANEHHFQHAQLPISEYFSQLKTRKVLTVNQVFEILVNYLEDKDWKKAFERVIPARKL